MKVYPTFAVVPTYPPIIEMLGRSGGDMAMVVHGGQSDPHASPHPGERHLRDRRAPSRASTT
jgi:hypothetical protein